MLTVIMILLALGTLGAGLYAVDVWAHKDCPGTRCAICQDVSA